jgi:hypothetical protein
VGGRDIVRWEVFWVPRPCGSVSVLVWRVGPVSRGNKPPAAQSTRRAEGQEAGQGLIRQDERVKQISSTQATPRSQAR